MLWIALLVATLVVAILCGLLVWRNQVVPQAPQFPVAEGSFNAGAKQRLCGSGSALQLKTSDGMTYRFPVPAEVTASPPRCFLKALNGRLAGNATARGSGPGNLEYSLLASSPEIVVGAAASYDVIHNTLLLDDTVLRAMTQLSGIQVNNLADFRHVMAEHNYQLESAKFQGTVAEQMSADHFQEAGAKVAWPGGGSTEYGASNNPGWDYEVSDVEVNSKAWGDAGDAARAHFGTPENVDIPIVVPADAAHIPADALHLDPSQMFDATGLIGDHLTVVDQALTLSGIDAVTAHASAVDLDPSIDMDDVGNDAIPGLGIVIVAVRSGVSQGRLVHDGKTDPGRAAKNVAVDATFRGGGALVGAKAGALAGLGIDAAFGGLTLGMGTVVCGIGGAIGGAMFGGRYATKLKLEPLRNAQESLRAEIRTLGYTVEQCSTEAQQRYAEIEAAQRQCFLAEAEVARRRYAGLLWNLGGQMRRAAVLTPDQVQDLLDGAGKAVDAAALAYTAEVSSRRGLDALIARRRRRELDQSVRIWRTHAHQVLRQLPSVRIPAVFDVVIAAPGGDRVADAYVDHVLTQREGIKQQAMSVDRRLVTTLTDLRYCAVQSLRHESEELLVECEREIDPHLARVKEAESLVRRELTAAGFSEE